MKTKKSNSIPEEDLSGLIDRITQDDFIAVCEANKARVKAQSLSDMSREEKKRIWSKRSQESTLRKRSLADL